jgi:hypothetical protein
MKLRVASIVVSALAVSAVVYAAPTSAPTPATTLKPAPVGPTPPPTTTGPVIPPKPIPNHVFKFDGDLKDSVVPGIEAHPYTNNLGPKWEAGKNGKSPGAIRGFGFLDPGKNMFVYPSFTIEFTIWPQAWNGKADGNCQTANVFSNAYHVTIPGVPEGAFGSWQERELIWVTGCGDKYADQGKVGVFWDIENSDPQKSTAIFEHPLKSDTWHDVSVVFDGAARTITLFIDGNRANSVAVAGPFKVYDALKNRVFIGLESRQGWVPGIVDELRFYATAVYPPVAHVNTNAVVR